MISKFGYSTLARKEKLIDDISAFIFKRKMKLKDVALFFNTIPQQGSKLKNREAEHFSLELLEKYHSLLTE